MLPPSWKRETEAAIEDAQRRNNEERELRERDEKSAITCHLAALVDQKAREVDENKKDQKIKRRTDCATLFFVFLTALFTGLAWWIFRGQLHEMEKVYNPIAEQAKTAAKQIGLMETQLRESKDIGERTLRAYVYTTLEFKRPVEGENFEIRLFVRTIGQTPAFDVHARLIGAIDGIPFSSDKVMDERRDLVVPGERKLLLPPDTLELFFLSPQKPAREDLNRIEKADIDGAALRFYGWGDVTYKDAFGCLRRVNFCYGFGTKRYDGKQCPGRNGSDDPAICDREK